MTTPARARYTGYRFPAEIIGHAVWLYFRFPLGLRMVEELLAARGIIVSHEILDARGASFVSVTQQFNTTTSMGRLTLNVRLSFAQFEREVIGERIRDKIAASKRKGMWMGGVPPLETIGLAPDRLRTDRF